MNTMMITGLGLAGLLAAVSISTLVGGPPRGEGATSRPGGDTDTFKGRVFDADGTLTGPVAMAKVRKPDAEWRTQLTREQYDVVRKAGTERPFTGPLLKNKTKGVYTCVACGLPLFESGGKFDSGTGWPSWFKPIAPENVDEHADMTHGMRRVEITCARCDGHLGHVFEDGPQPTGLRYCVNSASLGFTPLEEVRSLAEPHAMNNDAASPNATSRAVFAGGCFWCVEAVFEELEGVHEVVSGYAGGDEKTADYKTVCSGKTKHAEAVEIVYDPTKISFVDLLEVHFATHDPTQLNRQGNDVGPQYRSAIFYANAEEKALAAAAIEDIDDQKVFKSKIVTTLEPLEKFYPAEPYHQNYVCNNPTQGYVRGVALPKVEKVRKKFKDRLKAESPLERKR